MKKKKEDGLKPCARSCLKEKASCTQCSCKYWIDYDKEQAWLEFGQDKTNRSRSIEKDSKKRKLFKNKITIY